MSRPANVEDAIDAVEAVRQSIAVLCVADHQNDPHTLQRWLANKTPGSFADWLSNPDNFCVVAEVDGRVQGVGLLHRSGELKLFYVAPEYARKGLGRSIHSGLAARAADWMLPRLYLDSTFAARPFYESLGYKAQGESRLLFGVLRVYPYEKRLQPGISSRGTASP